MMTFSSRAKNINALIVVLILTQTVPLLGQNSSAFADYLMAQRDYFRAITVYKKLFFESQDVELRVRYSMQIAEAYRLSGKHKSSIYFYSEALQGGATTEQQVNSFIGLGLNYYAMEAIPIARNHFKKAGDLDTSGKAKLFLGLMQMEQMQWQQAHTTFEETAASGRSQNISETAGFLADKSVSGAALPRKNPLLAAIMSSVIPGSGQMYAGHYFDGLQAMAYVGAFSLATYSAYRYDRDIRDSDALLLLSATITGIFYSANILGAYKTAKFRNMRIRQDFMGGVKKVIFEVSL